MRRVHRLFAAIAVLSVALVLGACQVLSSVIAPRQPEPEPEGPPAFHLMVGDTRVEGHPGSYCWLDPDTGQGICVDRAAPEFDSEDFVRLPAGEPIRLQLEEPIPASLHLSLSEDLSQPDAASTQLAPAGTTVTWEPEVASGDYILTALGRWEQGDAAYFFAVTIPHDVPDACAPNRAGSGMVNGLYVRVRATDPDYLSYLPVIVRAGHQPLPVITPTATPTATATLTPTVTRPPDTVPVYSYRVINEYSHDSDAFTQGLIFQDGIFYEGTGLYGQSTLRKVELETGHVLQLYELPDQFFGEGITICGNKLIQLTWRSHVGFVYDKNTFELLQEFTYPTEGWGITHDGRRLIMSDGTSTLYFWDPETLAEIGRVEVRDTHGPVARLNELEYIQGEVYANVWQTDRIARIDPQTGRVIGWVDLTGLLSSEDRAGRHVDVLNGIAYDAENDRLFVTGKLWPKLFEIELVPVEPISLNDKFWTH